MTRASSSPRSSGSRPAVAALAHVVCIVDADDAVGEGLGRLLESARLEAVSCASIEDLLRQAGGGRLGCVLLDLSTARLALPEVRSRLGAAMAGLPIIALSAQDEPST